MAKIGQLVLSKSLTDYEFLLDTVKLCSDLVRRRNLIKDTVGSEGSGNIGDFVLEWVKFHSRDSSLDPERFLALVHEDNIATIDLDSALGFLDLEKEILGPASNASIGDSSVTRRCISAIAGSCQQIEMAEEERKKLSGIIDAYSVESLRGMLKSLMVSKKRSGSNRNHHLVVKGSSISGVNGTWEKRDREGFPNFEYYRHGACDERELYCEFVIRSNEDYWQIRGSGRSIYCNYNDVGAEFPPAWDWTFDPDGYYRGFGSDSPLLFFCAEDDE